MRGVGARHRGCVGVSSGDIRAGVFHVQEPIVVCIARARAAIVAHLARPMLSRNVYRAARLKLRVRVMANETLGVARGSKLLLRFY